MDIDLTLSPEMMPGDPLPWFAAPLIGREDPFGIDKMGGRHVLILLFGSAAHPAATAALRVVESARDLLDDERALFFGVTIDPEDAARGRVANSLPGVRFLDDRARRISGACRALAEVDGGTAYRPFWLLVDPGLRVIGRFALGEGERAVAALRATLALPQPESAAPALIVPHVLEPDFCRMLIGLYETHGGAETGFMRTVDGRTVGKIDHAIKRRSDHVIAGEEVRAALRARLSRRLLPMIKRAFQFEATRIERYIVARYDAAEGGHFRAHRDNTTPGTAHRRFAVTINLNGDYDGGDLRFPEFGTRTYRAPVGGAVAFSCSLLHEATRMTAGRRYATLPFLYDDAGARVREANWESLAEREGTYRAFGEEPAAAAE